MENPQCQHCIGNTVPHHHGVYECTCCGDLVCEHGRNIANSCFQCGVGPKVSLMYTAPTPEGEANVLQSAAS